MMQCSRSYTGFLYFHPLAVCVHVRFGFGVVHLRFGFGVVRGQSECCRCGQGELEVRRPAVRVRQLLIGWGRPLQERRLQLLGRQAVPRCGVLSHLGADGAEHRLP